MLRPAILVPALVLGLASTARSRVTCRDTLRVTMYACSIEPCSFAYRVFRR